MSPYSSPFKRDGHEDDIALGPIVCVGLAHGFDYLGGSYAGAWEICWKEWKSAVLTCLDAELAQPTFNAFRHCVELGLKLVGPPNEIERTHNLPKLFRFASGLLPDSVCPWVEALVNDLHEVDRGGDQARYPVTGKEADTSLAKLCCFSGEALGEVLSQWVEIVESNWWLDPIESRPGNLEEWRSLS